MSLYIRVTHEARTEREEGAVSLINTSPFTATVPATYINMHIRMHIRMHIHMSITSYPIHIPMYLEIFHLHLYLHFFTTHRRLARRGRKERPVKIAPPSTGTVPSRYTRMYSICTYNDVIHTYICIYTSVLYRGGSHGEGGRSGESN